MKSSVIIETELCRQRMPLFLPLVVAKMAKVNGIPGPSIHMTLLKSMATEIPIAPHYTTLQPGPWPWYRRPIWRLQTPSVFAGCSGVQGDMPRPISFKVSSTASMRMART